MCILYILIFFGIFHHQTVLKCIHTIHSEWIAPTSSVYIFRLLHHHRLYKRIHATHHEWTAPTSISATYAHPVEHLVSTLLPAIIGPIIIGSHLATMWLWFTLGLMSTTVAHSGYHLPLFPSPEAHDYHHLK